MTDNEFKQKVSKLEEENKQLLNEAELLIQKLINSLQQTIVNWSPKFIEDTVKRQKELTQSLGVEGIRPLKTRIPEITAELPQFLAEKIEESKVWTHRLILNPENLPKEITRKDHTFKSPVEIENQIFHDNFSNNNYPRAAPSGLISVYRQAQTIVIRFLEEFGYQAFLPTPTHHNDYSDKMLSNDAMQILEEYKNNHSRRYTVMKNIEGVKSQKESEDVDSIWNQA